MEKAQSSKNLLGKIRGLFAREEQSTAGPTPRSAPPQSSKTVHPTFWKSSISGQLQPELQVLVIYFHVLRSKTRAYRTQQMIQKAGGKAEVLRLVGWELDQPNVTIEVKATPTGDWKCQQQEATGKEEPYGYVVMSSIFGIGFINSLSIPYAQIKNRSLYFRLDDHSQWTRVVN